MLAISLLAAGLPLVVASAGADEAPALTMDICHPAQSVMAAAAHCNLPTLTAQAAVGSCELVSPTLDAVAGAHPRIPDTPEVPPPKPRVFPAG